MLFLLGVLAFIFVAGPRRDTGAPRALDPLAVQAADSSVQSLKSAGLLARWDWSTGQVYVHPHLWHYLNVDQKATVLATLSDARVTAASEHWVYVADYQSGARLASYSPVSGMRLGQE